MLASAFDASSEDREQVDFHDFIENAPDYLKMQTCKEEYRSLKGGRLMNSRAIFIKDDDELPDIMYLTKIILERTSKCDQPGIKSKDYF